MTMGLSMRGGTPCSGAAESSVITTTPGGIVVIPIATDVYDLFGQHPADDDGLEWVADDSTLTSTDIDENVLNLMC